MAGGAIAACREKSRQHLRTNPETAKSALQLLEKGGSRLERFFTEHANAVRFEERRRHAQASGARSGKRPVVDERAAARRTAVLQHGDANPVSLRGVERSFRTSREFIRHVDAG